MNMSNAKHSAIIAGLTLIVSGLMDTALYVYLYINSIHASQHAPLKVNNVLKHNTIVRSQATCD